MDPLEQFNKWYTEELNLAKATKPSACCFSTIGTDGFPNARFVSLKAVVGNNFIVTGSVASRKGIEINGNNKVALTFWWTATERQVRVQGNAVRITEQLADKYFAERSRESQIVSIVSEQGKETDHFELLAEKYENTRALFAGKPLSRPENWGGYQVEPVRIEFLTFKPTRFHERKLYELTKGEWITKHLQP